jgi:uncharacterized protein (TIGR02145 family)
MKTINTIIGALALITLFLYKCTDTFKKEKDTTVEFPEIKIKVPEPEPETKKTNESKKTNSFLDHRNGPDIDDISAIKSYIKGKWHVIIYDYPVVTYLFEITDTDLTYWQIIGKSELNLEPTKKHKYFITDVIRGQYGGKYRFIDTENADISLRAHGYLTYRNNCMMLDAMTLKKGWDKYESIMNNLKSNTEELDYEALDADYDESYYYYDFDTYDYDYTHDEPYHIDEVEYPKGTVHCSASPTIVVDVINPKTGKTWMDRNLGASQVASSSNNAAAYGDRYQWGRRSDGHQCRNSATTNALSSTDTPAHGNFIIASSSPNDWRSPQNTNLWQGVNGVNNPCPSGYRLPTETEFNAERLSWSRQNAAGAFSSPLKLPLAGHRTYSNGSFSNLGVLGYYWSSTVSGTNSRYLFFSSSVVNMNAHHRALGLSVRCIKN